MNDSLVVVESRDVDAAPAFRFLFDGEAIYVVPWGLLSAKGLLRDLEEPWEGAVGDVCALDEERAVAIFTRVDETVREQVEDKLRAWAAADGWELEIQPEEMPLASSDEPHPRIEPSSHGCPACGVHWPIDEEAEAFLEHGFFRTRCQSCGHQLSPHGLVRCETCGETRGWIIEGTFGEIEALEVSCICEGILCSRCGINLARRPTSNYYDETDKNVWHVPHFAGGVCAECRAKE